ncbi:hypothetical protein [Microbacterium sufflavum]|uniref:Helix-turn-helix domain-containing protein n=1 Tax=Microbacterium sufflavum TaxID=2851649 RepID=A0ABY4IHW3_9MICO|nr:hypothetical protein [Microbacterium sufflavum]UPL12179.1 hypothetical protein KV394_14130 [Microbacterium sufflavum]
MDGVIVTPGRRRFATDDATTYGAGLIGAAYAAAMRAGLGDVPMRLLGYMALHAIDADAQPWSRLSMDERCAALGRDNDQAGRWAVERATKALVKAGLITLLEGGNRSGAARYALHVRPADNSEKDQRSAPTFEPRKPGAQRSKGQRSALGKVSAQRRANEDRGEHEEERASARPAAQCSRHAGRADAPPCGACRDARLAAEAYDASEAERAADARRARAAALTDPSAHAEAIEATRRRLGGSTAAVVAAALRASPDSLPVGLRLITADDVERWG